MQNSDLKSVDQWWHMLARIAAAMRGVNLEELEPVDGVWPSEEARALFADCLDRGVEAYDVLAPAGRTTIATH